MLHRPLVMASAMAFAIFAGAAPATAGPSATVRPSEGITADFNTFDEAHPGTALAIGGEGWEPRKVVFIALCRRDARLSAECSAYEVIDQITDNDGRFQTQLLVHQTTQEPSVEGMARDTITCTEQADDCAIRIYQAEAPTDIRNPKSVEITVTFGSKTGGGGGRLLTGGAAVVAVGLAGLGLIVRRRRRSGRRPEEPSSTGRQTVGDMPSGGASSRARSGRMRP